MIFDGNKNYMFKDRNVKKFDFNIKNDFLIFFDLGANIGEITQRFLDKNRQRNFIVQAFEANTDLYFNLAARFCNVNNVCIYNNIVSSQFGKGTFLKGKKAFSTNGMVKNLAKDWNSDHSKFLEEITVEKINIAEFIKDQCRFAKAHLTKENSRVIVKMDIEGSEWEVIEEMIKKNTFKIVDDLLVEFHGPDKDKRAKKVVKNISSNFRTKVYKEVGPGNYYLM